MHTCRVLGAAGRPLTYAAPRSLLCADTRRTLDGTTTPAAWRRAQTCLKVRGQTGWQQRWAVLISQASPWSEDHSCWLRACLLDRARRQQHCAAGSPNARKMQTDPNTDTLSAALPRPCISARLPACLQARRRVRQSPLPSCRCWPPSTEWRPAAWTGRATCCR